MQTEQQAGWAPGPIRMRRRREKFLSPCRQTHYSSTVQPVGTFLYRLRCPKKILYFHVFLYKNKWKNPFFRCCGLTRTIVSSFIIFLDHKQRRKTFGRTPLDECSARRIKICLTTVYPHNRLSSILILLECCLHICMTYTIAVCTVKNSWWWTEELSETCRVSFQE
jgi:hypothetical protein